ncbi:DNA-processing protein DprA [Dokdonella soli]|uniref:DNA-processing protein DprA n=1 Tax=Dokdonella soli TaxID=529810 RepID=A0ABN1IGS6_9GAMM
MDVESNRASLEAWLILLRAPGLGAATLRALLARHGSAESALAAARRGEHERAADAACAGWLRAPDAATIANDLTWLAAPEHALLTFDTSDFPALLNEIPSPPAALFVAGDASALWRPQIAIVGSRNASQGGLATAAAFARALAAAGFAVTSGLAEGIDGAAHTATLDAGDITIAVLGTGPDLVYPPKHRELAARIAMQGALVSEFPPGTPGQPTHFPRRNRIIAGLSLGTLVVEAGVRSGSLITARNASESGREVFAIPGSIHNPLARGCHQLIRSGAKLVETAEEIISELAPLAQRLGSSLRERLDAPQSAPLVVTSQPPPPGTRPATPPRADYAKLFAALGHDALGIDQLAERTGLAVATLSSMLLMLELEGEVVAARGGGYARRVPGQG